jgi:hypothetical protein
VWRAADGEAARQVGERPWCGGAAKPQARRWSEHGRGRRCGRGPAAEGHGERPGRAGRGRGGLAEEGTAGVGAAGNAAGVAAVLRAGVARVGVERDGAEPLVRQPERRGHGQER